MSSGAETIESGRAVESCIGKIRFDSMALALKVAARRRRAGKPCVAYACGECDGVHIGFSEKKVQRRGR